MRAFSCLGAPCRGDGWRYPSPFSSSPPPALPRKRDDEEALPSYDEVVVTIGSRRAARSDVDSTAPVDAIGGEDFTDQATSDISDLLRVVVPSYNVNTQPISDGGTSSARPICAASRRIRRSFC